MNVVTVYSCLSFCMCVYEFIRVRVRVCACPELGASLGAFLLTSSLSLNTSLSLCNPSFSSLSFQEGWFFFS